MCAKQQYSAFSAVSLATLTFALALPARSALADNSVPVAGVPPNLNSQQHLSIRANIYSLQLPPLEDKAGFNVAPKTSGSNLQQEKSATSKTSDNLGLHWSTVDSHPGVAYRLNNSQDVQIHVNGRGAGGNLSVHF